MHDSTPRRTWRRMVVGAASAALMIGSASVAATPARADNNLTLSVAQGAVVGMPTNVAISGASSTLLGAQASVVFSFNNGATQQITIGVSGNGSGTGTWIPQSTGGFTALATSPDGLQTGNTSGSVAQVATTTTVNAPNVVGVNQAVTLTATVAANGGSTYGPTGSVQFAIQGGANIGQPVALNGATPSTATVSWTPTSLGTVNIVATYIPAKGGGAACGSACTSAVDAISVTASGSNVGISVPPMYLNTPVTITATVYVPSFAGSIAFTANGVGIGGSMPVGANGVTSVTYTPTALGNVTIATTWSGNNGQSGATSQTVTVQAQGKVDTITVDPNGDPTPWNAGGSNAVAPGNYVLVTKTASGSPVTLAVAGAGCTLTGTTLVVAGTSGTCTLTAASAGGNGYSPATATYALAIGAGGQTANLAIPNSGKIKKGRTITLATPAQGTTSAGQAIEWSVVSGKPRCKISYPANGAVKMKKTKNGSCTVVGVAGAAGGFGPFYIQRTYS